MANKIGVVGLGYVGLPVAAAFAEKYPVLGVDINRERIDALRAGVDATGEVSAEKLLSLQRGLLELSHEGDGLSRCDFIIVAVPTPVDHAKMPDLTALKGASKLVGTYLSPGTTVVYESTVYPGATEEICIPILESASGLKAGVDFQVGYSPERINPGDEARSFKRIVKVVSGLTEQALKEVAATYGAVVEAGIYEASSIKVAEAAKVIENTQRDLNIALMNELSIIFHELRIDTKEVLAAAGTKWNFLPFSPGLVGGHCIGVDPYYLTYKAESIGYHPEVILAGRKINDQMGQFVATHIVKQMLSMRMSMLESNVVILGLTFKENVPDIRNTKVVDIVQGLREFNVNVQLSDPLADPADAREEYGIELIPEDELEPADVVVIAVAHRHYFDLGWDGVKRMLRNGQGLVFDLKGLLDKDNTPAGIALWRL